MIEPKLCYIEDNLAWFTTKPLKDQWGDDWNDAPYEHNAEPPYGPCWHNEPEHILKRGGEPCTCQLCKRDWHPNGTPRWTLERLEWTGPFLQPRHGHINSPYTVQQINAGTCPWLRTEDDRNPSITIYAGTTIHEFILLITNAGGSIRRIS